MDERRGRIVAWSAGVLLAAIGIATLLASRTTTPLSQDPWFILSAGVVCISFAILLAAGTPDLFAWCLSALRRLGTPDPNVIIEMPSPDQRVAQAITAHGTARNVPEGLTLWLIVQDGHEFYPQTKVYLPPNGTGRWAQPVHFGRVAGDVGQTFTLYAVGADAATNSRFEIFLQQEAAHQNPPALTEAGGTYPRVVTYASVSVIRGL
jgi:hypothetical protein